MALEVAIAETQLLRRLAGSLASSLAGTVAAPSGRLDTKVQCGMFFRLMPWSGQRRRAGSLPDSRSSTVGQYFNAFPWEGPAHANVPDSPEPAQARHRAAGTRIEDLIEHVLGS